MGDEFIFKALSLSYSICFCFEFTFFKRKDLNHFSLTVDFSDGKHGYGVGVKGEFSHLLATVALSVLEVQRISLILV